MSRRVALLILGIAIAAAAVWGVFHFTAARRSRFFQSATELANVAKNASAYSWDVAVEKVKADRGEGMGGSLEIPPELKHYEERYWFLATQVAEIEKYKVHPCQDYLDLAAMVEKRELVPVPAVTNTYVLFGVGQRADEQPFTRFDEGNHSVEIYNETQLADAYRHLDEKRSNLQNEIKSLNGQATRLTRRERGKRSELQKQINSLQQQLKSIDENKALLDQNYGEPDTRQKLFGEYQSLEKLARNFNGRSYDLGNLADRRALKVNMLSSARPEALKIIEQVAAAYHQQFDRPLPVSSLVRPEQYQHVLRRVNRNAVTIETPPHSTGLAFDIDYRYMSVAEQNFVMRELARLKHEGRIEVIRERNANYHVFAFINGTRPANDLIQASLEKAGAPAQEAHHSAAKPAKVKSRAGKTQRSRLKARVSRKRRR